MVYWTQERKEDSHRFYSSDHDDASDILKEYYAKGEIAKEQLNRRCRVWNEMNEKL
ncbi:MAG TPA: hypothetical protein VH796_01925 [Nitrososphaeraceae archaeon]|jgi:uncharacterized membrane protein